MENFIKLQTSSVGSTAKMFVSKYKKLNNTDHSGNVLPILNNQATKTVTENLPN